MAYLVSQGFWKQENEFKVACNGHEDKTTHVHGGEGEKSPGNTGLPGEKEGGHLYWSSTHLIHPPPQEVCHFWQETPCGKFVSAKMLELKL